MRAAIVAGLVLSLVFAPSTTAYAEEPTVDVRTLHERGKAWRQGGDYEQALIFWNRAFVLPDTDQELRSVLVADIVDAHTRAYELGRNPEHLAEAMRVIDLRKAELDEAASLDAARAELARLHELALSRGEQPSELRSGVALHIESTPPPALTGKQLDAELVADHELGRDFRRAKGMKDGGFIFMMIGVAAIGTAAILMVTAFDATDEGVPALQFLIPAPIIVGVPIIVGGTLYGIGKKRKKQIMAEYEARPYQPRAVPMPLAFPHGGGIGFVGRF